MIFIPFICALIFYPVYLGIKEMDLLVDKKVREREKVANLDAFIEHHKIY
jgi:hypothetical protein